MVTLFWLILLYLIFQAHALTICIEDYKRTNYYLFCDEAYKSVLVNSVAVSYISRSSRRYDCLTQPSLTMNVTTQIAGIVCGMCYNSHECV